MGRGLCTFSAECPQHTVGARETSLEQDSTDISGESTTSLALSLSILILRAESGFDWTYLVQFDLLSEIPYRQDFKKLKALPNPSPPLPR